ENGGKCEEEPDDDQKNRAEDQRFTVEVATRASAHRGWGAHAEHDTWHAFGRGPLWKTLRRSREIPRTRLSTTSCAGGSRAVHSRRWGRDACPVPSRPRRIDGVGGEHVALGAHEGEGAPERRIGWRAEHLDVGP